MAPEFGAWPGLSEPFITFSARDWPTRLGMVAAGLGIALVPGSMSPALPRTVTWVQITDAAGIVRRTTYAATAAAPDPAADAFVNTLEREASRL